MARAPLWMHGTTKGGLGQVLIAFDTHASGPCCR